MPALSELAAHGDAAKLPRSTVATDVAPGSHERTRPGEWPAGTRVHEKRKVGGSTPAPDHQFCTVINEFAGCGEPSVSLTPGGAGFSWEQVGRDVWSIQR